MGQQQLLPVQCTPALLAPSLCSSSSTSHPSLSLHLQIPVHPFSLHLAGFQGVLCTPDRCQHHAGVTVTAPIHPNAAEHAGSSCPAGVRRATRFSCTLLAVCHLWVPRTGETARFDSSASSLETLLPSTSPYTRKQALLHLFLLWGAGFLRLQRKQLPKTSAVSQVSKGATPGACCKHQNAKSGSTGFFYKAHWYSMYLEGLKSHLPVFNYLTIHCFP